MTRQLRIAFFGSSLVSAYWNGAATYYRGIVRALAERGHAVTFYEPDAFERQAHRDMADPDWAEVVVYPAADAADALAAVECAADVDVIVKASGVGVHDDVLARAVLEVDGPPLRLFWDVDAPATLAELEASPEAPLRELVPWYDLVLTYGGGDVVVERYCDLGARACVPVYNALDPETHFPVERDPALACDLLFVGNRLPDREARVEEFFLRAAELAPDRDFVLGGSGWEERSLPPNVRRLGHVFTRDHNVLNASALAVLNVTRDSMAAVGFSPPTRVFEVAGAGGCLITDAWEGIEAFLEPGREVLVAHDGAEVAELVRGVNPEHAALVGAAGRARILRDHSYARRAEQVETLLLRALAPSGTPS